MVKIVRQMTEEKRAEILRLWNLGYSSSKIAAEIGLSRNSVIGAVHRMRQAGVEIISKERVKSKKVAKPKAPKPPKKDPFYNKIGRATRLNSSHTDISRMPSSA